MGDLRKDADAKRGVYRKYLVKRLRDREKKHANCEFFVLDLMHDKYSAAALKAYADACEAEFPALARDMRSRVTPDGSSMLPRSLWRRS